MGETRHYPQRLLPTTQKRIILHTELNKSDYLGKWVDGYKQLKDQDGKLNAAAIEINRIPGFSTNKIPSSKKRDLNILFKKEVLKNYTSEWQEYQEINQPSKYDYNFENTRQHYFIQISKIDQFRDHYTNPPGNINARYEFEVVVAHKPLVSNYWHFELTVFANNVEIKSIDSKPWRKLLCSTIRDRIQEVAVFKI